MHLRKAQWGISYRHRSEGFDLPIAGLRPGRQMPVSNFLEQVAKMASKAEQLVLSLAGLITEAESLEPLLADRLKQISKWVAKFSPGQLTAKKYVIDVLEQICKLSEQWLILALCDAKEKGIFLSTLDLADMYWSTCLFSSWFRNIDLKQSKWQTALVNNQFVPSDTKVLARIRQTIHVLGGTSVSPLLADLAMATDIIATASRGQPLCIQLTTQSGNYLLNKYASWEIVLQHWGIEKGLLICYTPRKGYEQDIAQIILHQANNLPEGEYRMETLL
jgi:hypothetical protein